MCSEQTYFDPTDPLHFPSSSGVKAESSDTTLLSDSCKMKLWALYSLTPVGNSNVTQATTALARKKFTATWNSCWNTRRVTGEWCKRSDIKTLGWCVCASVTELSLRVILCKTPVKAVAHTALQQREYLWKIVDCTPASEAKPTFFFICHKHYPCVLGWIKVEVLIMTPVKCGVVFYHYNKKKQKPFF